MTSPRHSQIIKEHSSATYAPSDSGERWASAPIRHAWDPAILACDGGGMRGYSSLLILQRLMHEVAQWENKFEKEENPGSGKKFDESQLLPCHYFDYMYGTSTGGLIATLLGRLRMSIPQCLKIYRDVGDKLFGIKNKRGYLPLMTRYHHKPLERIVQEVIRDHCKQHPPGAHVNGEGKPGDKSGDHSGHCPGDDWHPWNDAIPNNEVGADYNLHICQSVCLTATPNTRLGQAHLLRTFDHNYRDIPNWLDEYNDGADKLRIWQATRATSAAPFYFDALEVEIMGQKQIFKDGGIRENNPSVAAWTEFVSRYGESRDGERNEPSLLLSIGTGRPDESKDGFGTAWAWPFPFSKSRILRKCADKLAVFQNVLIKYTEGEEKHREMLNIARGETAWYKRLNVSSGLEKLALDDWKHGSWTDPDTGQTKNVAGGKTLTLMETATKEYLAREAITSIDSYAAPKVKLHQAAEKLVRLRRAREAQSGGDPMRWNTFMGKYLTGKDSDIMQDGPICHRPDK